MPRFSSQLIQHALAATASAVLFFVLSDVASIWGGGLVPNPLWLATASTTSLAALLPRRLHAATVVGTAVGCVAAGPILFDETLRSLVTPCLGNTAEAAIAVALLRRALGPEVALQRTRRAVAWIGTSLLAAFAGGVIATSDTTAVVIDERFESLLRWTLGDVLGLLLLPPLVIAFRSPWVTPRHRLWVSEAGLALGILIGVLLVSFRGDSAFPYALVPIVMWIGIRFGPRLAMPAAMVVALGSTYLTAQDTGPFIRFGSNAVAQVQTLNVAVALSALIASAHAVRAWNDHQQLRATLAAVPDVIVSVAPDGRPLESWGPPELRTMVSELFPVFPQTSAGDAEPSSDAEESTLGSVPNPRPTAPTGPIERHWTGRIFERRTTAIDGQKSLHLFRDITARHEAKQARLELEHQVHEARYLERQVLARDLHDGPIQTVTAAKLLIERAAELHPGDPTLLGKAVEALVATTNQLRASLDDLAASSGGSLHALAQFGTDLLFAVDMQFQFEDRTAGRHLDPGLRSALMLIGREAILNAASHSGAAVVTLRVAIDDDTVDLTVVDDGVGMATQVDDGRVHLGLVSMTARAEALGGTLSIDSNRGTGTEVRVSIPTTASSSSAGVPIG